MVMFFVRFVLLLSCQTVLCRRFLSDWNKKVEEFRETWASKVEELREKMRNRAWGGVDSTGGERAPLLLLARMYTQERSAIDELQDMWNRNPKWTEFFLPQVRVSVWYGIILYLQLLSS